MAGERVDGKELIDDSGMSRAIPTHFRSKHFWVKNDNDRVPV
jgi:hypothetical protein